MNVRIGSLCPAGGTPPILSHLATNRVGCFLGAPRRISQLNDFSRDAVGGERFLNLLCT